MLALSPQPKIVLPEADQLRLRQARDPERAAQSKLVAVAAALVPHPEMCGPRFPWRQSHSHSVSHSVSQSPAVRRITPGSGSNLVVVAPGPGPKRCIPKPAGCGCAWPTIEHVLPKTGWSQLWLRLARGPNCVVHDFSDVSHSVTQSLSQLVVQSAIESVSQSISRLLGT